jgi:ribosome biogenesis GTPase
LRRNIVVPSRKEKQWRHHEEQKQIRRVRKQIKRNRKAKRVRHKEWRQLDLYEVPDDLDDLDTLYDLGSSEDQRVMPRGERERRQAMIDAALAARTEEETGEAISTPQMPGEQGLVVEVSSGLCRVEVDGRTMVCAIRGSLSAEETGYTNVVAVGDQVLVSEDENDRGIVQAVLPRHGVLARPDVFHNHLKQVIVANVDQLLIVASWRDPKFWPELIDRYLIAAQRNGLTPILCVNKVDLAGDIATCRTEAQPYVDLGYRILFTSAITGEGIGRLKNALCGQVTVLAGMSGVGKSTLLNAVQPGLQLRTGDVSDWSHTGRHTTSQVHLIQLELGGYVVDTPGIREFGLSGLRQEDLIQHYPELAAFEGQCRFADCSHTHEPGCAVQAAVRGGHISRMRLKNFQRIYATLPKSRAQEREMAQERTWR